MQKSIIFDTGPIISLVTNNLLWILEPLKNKFNGEFYITHSVKRELVDKALSTKRFEFEALQICHLLNKGIIKIIDNQRIEELSKKLLNLANQSFKARGNYLNIVSGAEIEALAADSILDSETTVIDERTVRLLLENPQKLADLMEKKLHCKVIQDKENISNFRNLLKNVQIIRSTELVTVAYKLGFLNDYLIKAEMIRNPKKRLLDSLLWAVKVRGASISGKEIKKIVELEA